MKSSAIAGNWSIGDESVVKLSIKLCWPPNTAPVLVGSAGFAFEVGKAIASIKKITVSVASLRMTPPSMSLISNHLRFAFVG